MYMDTNKKMIYTSYFGKCDINNINNISIAGKCPKWFIGREYKKLAPKYWFFKKYKEDGDKDYYIEQYQKYVLDKLDPQEVFNELGEDSVILCWEKSGDLCHRYLVAEWFKKHLGIEVLEIE